MVVAVTRPTRLNISQAAVTHNVQQVRESAQASFVFLAVKANAYGFGLVPMSQAALAGGVDGLAVAVLDEGLALRQAGLPHRFWCWALRCHNTQSYWLITK